MTKKELILKATARLFAEKGYSETSMDDIITAAGVAKGTVYYHFGNKGDLLGEILGQTFAAYKERLDLISGSTKPSIEKIVQFARCATHFLYKYPHEVKTLMRDAPWELCGSPHRQHGAVWENLCACFETIISIYAEVFEQGMQDGSIRKQNPRESALVLDSLIRGSIRLRMLSLVEIPNLSRPIAETVRLAFEVRS